MGEEGAVVIEGQAVIVLREVREEDLVRLMNHRNEWDTRRWLENCRVVTLEDQRRWFETLSRSCRIAECEGVPVGLVRISQDGMESYLVGCDVFGEFRGRGFGHHLFAAACQRARDYGAKSLSLWVFTENEAAVRIYRRAGFDWDYSTPAMTFYRPQFDVGTPRTWTYARMRRAA